MFTFSLRNIPVWLINSTVNLPIEFLGVISESLHSFLTLPLGTHRPRLFHSPREGKTSNSDRHSACHPKKHMFFCENSLRGSQCNNDPRIRFSIPREPRALTELTPLPGGRSAHSPSASGSFCSTAPSSLHPWSWLQPCPSLPSWLPSPFQEERFLLGQTAGSRWVVC